MTTFDRGEGPDSVLRADLVAANRILVRQSVLDAFGHVSVRSSNPDRFLLARNLAPGSVTPADVLLHEFDGRAQGDRALYLERYIHAEIYRHRPDVMAVVHSHSPSVVPFSVVDVPLRPVVHMAAFLGEHHTPVFEIADHAGGATDLLITNGMLGSALASTLGKGSVVLMRGHGSVVVGADLPEAVYRAIYTEVNARTQAEAIALGEPRYLTGEEGLAATKSVGSQVARAWDVWREQCATEQGGLTSG